MQVIAQSDFLDDTPIQIQSQSNYFWKKAIGQQILKGQVL